MKWLCRPAVVLAGDALDIGEGVARGPERWLMAQRLPYLTLAAMS